MGRVEERMMEWNSLQRRRRPPRLMYWSQQWCMRHRSVSVRSSQTTRYALNELADIPRGRVMDMKMAWRAARPASPTTTTSSTGSSSSSMTHIKSPAPADLSAIGSQQTGSLAVDSWASLPARQTIYHPPTGPLPLRPILYIIHRNKFSAVTTR